MKEKILQTTKNFIWEGKDKRPRVRWEIMIKKPEEGGAGIKDPIAMIDATRVNLLVKLMSRNRQPWMRWIERKLNRVAREWGVKEAMASKPTKSMTMKLKETCIAESALRVWIEIGGRKEPSRNIPEEHERGEIKNKKVRK